MFKMGSHYSFGHLKHKLWAKERPIILEVAPQSFQPKTKKNKFELKLGFDFGIFPLCNHLVLA
jgi:hypothetical protein